MPKPESSVKFFCEACKTEGRFSVKIRSNVIFIRCRNCGTAVEGPGLLKFIERPPEEEDGDE